MNETLQSLSGQGQLTEGSVYTFQYLSGLSKKQRDSALNERPWTVPQGQGEISTVRVLFIPLNRNFTAPPFVSVLKKKLEGVGEGEKEKDLHAILTGFDPCTIMKPDCFSGSKSSFPVAIL